MLKWSSPQLSDGEWIREIVGQSKEMGSDVSFANIFLLRDKYDIQICNYRGFFVRHYNGYYGRKGYTFPIGEGNIHKMLEELFEDAKRRREQLSFCLLTQEQKEFLEEFYPEQFIYVSNPGDSDYIYDREELANLRGKAFHKKKNHVSKFMRSYPDYRFAQIGKGNWEDARLVEDIWYYEHMQEEDTSQLKEYAAIKEALENFEELELSGGILYVKDTPIAMTIASSIGKDTWDIHFEKAVGECAMNGAYAAINQWFAQTLPGVWLNREEDIGLEGLRKAKMSYRPKMLLKKYNAVLI